MTKMPKPVVLIVDDEHLIRMLAVHAFTDDGFIVFEAEDAAAAILAYAKEIRIHLLFTDVNMPGEMNGIDLAEHLKALSPDLKVIITSALPVLRPVNDIPAMFVSKPYHIDDVCRAARALLAG